MSSVKPLEHIYILSTGCGKNKKHLLVVTIHSIRRCSTWQETGKFEVIGLGRGNLLS